MRQEKRLRKSSQRLAGGDLLGEARAEVERSIGWQVLVAFVVGVGVLGVGPLCGGKEAFGQALWSKEAVQEGAELSLTALVWEPRFTLEGIKLGGHGLTFTRQETPEGMDHLLLLDTSCSMRSVKAQAKQVATSWLGQAQSEGVRHGIFFFDSDLHPKCSECSVEQGNDAIRSWRARGGETCLSKILVQLASQHASLKPTLLTFLSDGISDCTETEASVKGVIQALRDKNLLLNPSLLSSEEKARHFEGLLGTALWREGQTFPKAQQVALRFKIPTTLSAGEHPLSLTFRNPQAEAFHLRSSVRLADLQPQPVAERSPPPSKLPFVVEHPQIRAAPPPPEKTSLWKWLFALLFLQYFYWTIVAVAFVMMLLGVPWGRRLLTKLKARDPKNASPRDLLFDAIDAAAGSIPPLPPPSSSAPSPQAPPSPSEVRSPIPPLPDGVTPLMPADPKPPESRPAPKPSSAPLPSEAPTVLPPPPLSSPKITPIPPDDSDLPFLRSAPVSPSAPPGSGPVLTIPYKPETPPPLSSKPLGHPSSSQTIPYDAAKLPLLSKDTYHDPAPWGSQASEAPTYNKPPAPAASAPPAASATPAASNIPSAPAEQAASSPPSAAPAVKATPAKESAFAPTSHAAPDPTYHEPDPLGARPSEASTYLPPKDVAPPKKPWLLFSESLPASVANLPAGKETKLGRSETNDLRLHDPSFSRQVALFQEQGGKLWLTPLSDGNPILVAGESRPCLKDSPRAFDKPTHLLILEKSFFLLPPTEDAFWVFSTSALPQPLLLQEGQTAYVGRRKGSSIQILDERLADTHLTLTPQGTTLSCEVPTLPAAFLSPTLETGQALHSGSFSESFALLIGDLRFDLRLWAR